jgi:hypothetical protein
MAPRRKRELDVPVPIQYPNGALAEPQWRACRDILARVYKLKEANRDVAEIFCALPAKEMYEDYYVAITEPECLDHIAVSTCKTSLKLGHSCGATVPHTRSLLCPAPASLSQR